VVDRHGHKSANPETIPREQQKNIPPGIEQVRLMASRNYKVSATVGVSNAVATPFYAILDTGAGQNLVREYVLPEDWLRYRVAGDTTYQVIGANGRSLPQRGVVTRWVQLGRLRAQALFIVVKQLSAGGILGYSSSIETRKVYTPRRSQF
jgi:Aspartyl protease